MEEKTDDDNSHNANAEDQLQLLLQEAGLESVPIDPTSLEALKAFVSTADYSMSVTTGDPSEAPPVSEVAPHPEFKRFTSELSADSLMLGRSVAEESSVATAGGYAPMEGASLVENHILEQLHRQTGILLEMQRRIDDLTATVEYLTSSDDLKRTTVRPATVRKRDMAQATPLAPPQTRPGAPAAAGAPAQPRAAVPNINNGGAGFLLGIRNSRLYQIGSAFVKLRRRYGVQPLDGGLIFKVLFMMAILSTRMASPSKHYGSTSNVEVQWKFFFVALLVVVGFLVQTGYFKYSYIFFVKENIAGRIWDGETVDDILRGGNNIDNNNNNNDPNNNNNNQAGGGQAALPRGQLPPGHPQHANDNNNNAAAGGWRNTFLGGIIPQANQGGIAGVVQDVALVFGSFLLSIFPMWQPEGPPQPREPAPQPPQQQQQPPPAGGLGAGPGAVRPPRDPVEAADDSDDEDNNYLE